jgi:hypothetical protein
MFSLLCLQENKLDVVTRELVLEMLGTDFDYLLFLQFVPCWDPGRLEHRYLIGTFHDFGLSLYFDGGHTAELTYLAFVTHHGLWAAKGWTQGHLPAKARIYRRIYGQTWVLCGDFNLIYLSTKKNNDQISRFPNGLEFMELHLYDRLFTSRNKQSHPTLKCIDNLT